MHLFVQTKGGSNRSCTAASAHSHSSDRQQHEEAQLRFDARDGTAASAGEQGRPASGTSAITLHYSSGWRQPTMLYSLQGADWTRCTLEPVGLCAAHPGHLPSEHMQGDGAAMLHASWQQWSAVWPLWLDRPMLHRWRRQGSGSQPPSGSTGPQ
jgi:hypothetical protein